MPPGQVQRSEVYVRRVGPRRPKTACGVSASRPGVHRGLLCGVPVCVGSRERRSPEQQRRRRGQNEVGHLRAPFWRRNTSRSVFDLQRNHLSRGAGCDVSHKCGIFAVLVAYMPLRISENSPSTRSGEQGQEGEGPSPMLGCWDPGLLGDYSKSLSRSGVFPTSSANYGEAWRTLRCRIRGKL